MLKLKPNCECCDRDLSPTADACICSFECTFCMECTERMDAVCPNCGGKLVTRPTRSEEHLIHFPASSERTAIKEGCLKPETVD